MLKMILGTLWTSIQSSGMNISGLSTIARLRGDALHSALAGRRPDSLPPHNPANME